MKVQPKTAKFFCENCGAEVARNAKVCRHCGRFFSSVRCPQCGKTGTPEQFVHGCPACGYTVQTSDRKIQKSENDKKSSFFSRKKLKKAINSYQKDSDRKDFKNTSEDSLPVWIFLVVIFVLAVTIFLFKKSA